MFLQNLTDFRDVRLSAKKSDQDLCMSKNSNMYMTQDCDIEMINNDKLLKNFK